MNFFNSILNTYLSLPTWGRIAIGVVAVAVALIGFVEGLESFGLIEFVDLNEPVKVAAEAATAS